MNRWLVLGVLLGGAALSACGTELTSGGADVRIGKAAPAGAVCDDLGVVYGSAGEPASAQDKLESSQNDLRNKTAALGGNFVLMDMGTADEDSMAISGHALKCSSGAPAGAVAVAPAATEFATDTPAPAAPTLSVSTSTTSPLPTPEQRLRALDELHRKSLITDAEYQERRKQVLDSL
ncbi:MAG TPA: DUF4156 domain-containing protein [Polyangiaceae bacterium]|nr:DUF4156 domain-containing protein [Polyangiaceae bacterium]